MVAFALHVGGKRRDWLLWLLRQPPLVGVLRAKGRSGRSLLLALLTLQDFIIMATSFSWDDGVKIVQARVKYYEELDLQDLDITQIVQSRNEMRALLGQINDAMGECLCQHNWGRRMKWITDDHRPEETVFMANSTTARQVACVVMTRFVDLEIGNALRGFEGFKPLRNFFVRKMQEYEQKYFELYHAKEGLPCVVLAYEAEKIVKE